ncbi:MAG: hypothetical protein JW750_10960, partial [Anaerolineaceae bacterium]|nr:hypothetical protein [Anaerolineaceae bacterium]
MDNGKRITSMMKSAWRWIEAHFQLVTTLMILLVGVLTFLTAGNDHLWGGDFSAYITHAKNLIEGKPYGLTRFVYNPEIPIYGPPAV